MNEHDLINSEFFFENNFIDVKIRDAVEFFHQKYLSDGAINVIHDALLIFNEKKQVVFANASLFKMLNDPLPNNVYGKNICELFNCVYAHNDSYNNCELYGCCSCGIETAFLNSQKAMSTEGVFCSVNNINNTFRKFSVNAVFELYRDNIYTIIALAVKWGQEENEILEKYFLHDISNTASSIKGVVDVLTSEYAGDVDKELLEMLNESVNTLSDEVNDHKQLTLGKKENLDMSIGNVLISELLNNFNVLYGCCNVFGNSTLELDCKFIDRTIYTNKTLLKRVVGNLLKNALESSKLKGTKVTYGCSMVEEGFIEFWVHNMNYMPEFIQEKIFNQSFSTKGEGRGVGIYSVKLLTEKYLKGKVSYITNKNTGTRFSIIIPTRI